MIGWHLIAVRAAKRSIGAGDESPWTPQLWHGGRCTCHACLRYFEMYDEAEHVFGFTQQHGGNPDGTRRLSALRCLPRQSVLRRQPQLQPGRARP